MTTIICGRCFLESWAKDSVRRTYEEIAEATAVMIGH